MEEGEDEVGSIDTLFDNNIIIQIIIFVKATVSFYSSPDPFRGDAIPEEETSQTHLNGAVQVFLSSSSTSTST